MLLHGAPHDAVNVTACIGLPASREYQDGLQTYQESIKNRFGLYTVSLEFTQESNAPRALNLVKASTRTYSFYHSTKKTKRKIARAKNTPFRLTPRFLVICLLTGYNGNMIKSFRHKGIQAFFETGSKAGIQSSHAPRLRIQLTRLDDATSPQDMNAPGWRLHPLKGEFEGHWSITVNGNWRLTLRFDGNDVILVDYQDYH